MDTNYLNELRKIAEPVRSPAPGTFLSARVVAQCLSGVVRLVATSCGHDEMRLACAVLAGGGDGWSGGAASGAERIIATAVDGFRRLASDADLRAALAFWATESDPAEWQRLVA